MAFKDNLYDAFLTDVEPGSEEFSLEDILAEYGGSRSQKLMEDVERSVGEEPAPRRARKEEKAAPQREKDPAGDKEQPPLTPREEARDKLLAQAVDLEELEKDLPRPPRPVSLEEVVGSTVEAVMEEQEPLLKPRKGLFSRKKMEDTEQLYGAPEPEEEDIAQSQAVEDTAYFQMRQRIADLLSSLDETDAKLLTLRFGLEKGLPMSAAEVGKILGLTVDEVTAREAQALAKLRNDK